jgi:hypothetical protein
MQPPEDFEELKKSIEEPRTTLTGLGDGAYMFHDKGDGRFKINVLKRGDLMFQATGETAESARKVADAVVAQLWKAASPPRLVERRVIGSEPRNGVPHADAAVPGRMAEMLPLIAHA